MRTLALFLSLALLMAASALAGPSETVIQGNISVSGTNTGTIVSVGGGKLKMSIGWGIASAGASIGSASDTETNVNSVIIYSGTRVTGDISLNGHNSGTIVNVGSKVNLNSIVLGK